MTSPNTDGDAEVKSILDNADAIISKYLDVPNIPTNSYRHKKYREAFIKSDQSIDGSGLLRALQKNIECNLPQIPKESKSKQNWRDRPISNINPKNPSKEVVLERHLAKIIEREKRTTWWNQMPVASGLAGSNSDRRRAIDLVHRNETGETYDFIELKIASDSPLYALMEVVQYGLIYLVLRDTPSYLSEISRASCVFQAKEIKLRVLAPEGFYADSLARFEQQLNDGFRSLLANRKDDLKISLASYFHPRLDQWSSGKPDELDGVEKILDINSWKRAFNAG